MKRFLHLICLLLMLLVVMAPLLPSRADFGDFSSDSDFGGGSDSDWGGSSDSDWDYGSSSSGRSRYNTVKADTGTEILMTVVTVIGVPSLIGFYAYLFHWDRQKKSDEKAASEQKSIQRSSGSEMTVAQANWGFQRRPTAEITVPEYRSEEVREACCGLYRRMQDAWGAGEMSSLRQDFTPDAYAQYERQLNQKNARGEHAHCIVHSVNAYERGWNENDHEWMLAVEIIAVISAWNENDNGDMISGSRISRKEMCYAWVMRKPKTETEGIQRCPNCGHEVEMNAGTVCPACGASLTAPGAGWQLSSIQAISQKTL